METLQQIPEENSGYQLANQGRQSDALRKLGKAAGYHEKNQNNQENVYRPLLAAVAASETTPGGVGYTYCLTLSCRLCLAA